MEQRLTLKVSKEELQGILTYLRTFRKAQDRMISRRIRVDAIVKPAVALANERVMTITERIIKDEPSVHCRTCGKLFALKLKQRLPFCSSECYHKDRYDRTRPAKKAIPQPVAPAAELPVAKPVRRRKETSAFRVFEVNGKATEVHGTPEQLDRFERRLFEQEADRLKKYKPVRKYQEETAASDE